MAPSTRRTPQPTLVPPSLQADFEVPSDEEQAPAEAAQITEEHVDLNEGVGGGGDDAAMEDSDSGEEDDEGEVELGRFNLMLTALHDLSRPMSIGAATDLELVDLGAIVSLVTWTVPCSPEKSSKTASSPRGPERCDLGFVLARGSVISRLMNCLGFCMDLPYWSFRVYHLF